MANEPLERICFNCNYYFPSSNEPTEYGICLDDEDFEPYIEDIMEYLDFSSCQELINAKEFLGDRDACEKFEEIVIIESDDDDSLMEIQTRSNVSSNQDQEHKRPHLTEDTIRRFADEQSFQRGVNYYSEGAVSGATMRGANELSGLCSGSRYEPYRVRVVLGEGGIREFSCTCPRGGFCKHIVALLLEYMHEPDSITSMPLLKQQLESFNREELIRLILEMIQEYPSLETMVDRRVLISRSSNVDKASLRRQVERVIHLGDPHAVERGLQDMLDFADDLKNKDDFAGAGMAYQEVLIALSSCYEYVPVPLDAEGDYNIFAGHCVDGLCNCLKATAEEAEDKEKWRPLRQAWLDTLLDAVIADMMMGDVGFAEEAFDIILINATAAEWVQLEARLRELIPHSSDWKKEKLVGMLTVCLKQTGRDSEADELIREMGTDKQIMFLLLREGKLQEAAAMARQHFTRKPGIVLTLAQGMAEVGAVEDGIALLGGLLADPGTSHSSYREWLANHYREKGEMHDALKWQYEVTLHDPTEKAYLLLREMAEKLESWEEVRTRLFNDLENKKAMRALLEFALLEGQVDRALELLPSISHLGWPDYREKVARAAAEKRPGDAIRLYREMAEHHIGFRQRPSYRKAAQYLKQAKAISKRIGNSGQWDQYITLLRKEYARYPALQDELNKAGV